jgi:hypothetical protein
MAGCCSRIEHWAGAAVGWPSAAYPPIKQQACNVCMVQELVVKLRVLVALALVFDMLI